MRTTTALALALSLPAALAVVPPPAAHAAPAAAQAAPAAPPALPVSLYGGAWPTSHVQGVAIDQQEGYAYYSFTQMLVKTDLEGNVVGTVEGLTGHLGDLDLNPDDGRVYGSLEYKPEEAFYIAVFDVDRIDRIGMDAEQDGVMTTVHLPDVVDDFTADLDGNGVFDGDVAQTPDHRYGSSGIDGVSFGPAFGGDGRTKLVVAYGIYTNLERDDNDHQVLLEYDARRLRRYERPLTQDAPHRSGPRSDDRFFVYTGNTHFGVQNLEYDPYTGNWMMAVYDGRKPQFPNYSLFMVDGDAQPVLGALRGQPDGEVGQLLPLLPYGLYDEATGLHGWESSGNYGLEALGDGRYYIAEGRAVVEDGVAKQDAHLVMHRWTGEAPTPFREVVDASS